MIELTIDNQKIKIDEGSTILDAAKSVGIEIPALCHHPSVEPYGACRLCMVEIFDGRKNRMVTACNYPIRKTLEVSTKSEKVLKNRKAIIGMMLSRWPNVKYIKDLAAEYKVEQPAYKHPLVDYNEKGCILCGLCVRICSEGIWESIIGFTGRGAQRAVSMPFEQHLNQCLGCGECAQICPTDAISILSDPNNPADAEKISSYGSVVTNEVIQLDDQQCRMRRVGTAHLAEIMNDYDLLPTFNYKFGSHENAPKISSDEVIKYLTQDIADGCWLGCSMACAKAADNFELKSGPYKGDRVLVDGPEYETVAGCGSNIGVWDPQVIIELNFYCDTYGLDTISYATSLAFAMECYENGILNKDRTEGLELYFGNVEASLEVIHQMSRGEGIGVVIGQGIRAMKKIFAEKYNLTEEQKQFMQDIGMECKGMEYSEYVTKESLAMQGGYGITNKGAQHDEAWLIFMDMVNNQIPTFEDKAEALHYFPMFRTWFSLNGLCKLPWNDVEPANNAETSEPNKVPGHVEGYVNFFNGMTGLNIDNDELIRQSERVYNFQRIFNLRMGYGTREFDKIPFRSAGPVTLEEYESRQERYDKQLKENVGVDPAGKSTEEKQKILRKFREEQYEKLCDAVYIRRGWTNNGIPKIEHLEKIGMDLPELIEVIKPFQE
ncbi:aldehyde ferredoxin oxidoreductase C-terminal domain-containing protein [candidate division KSB1 bacterium]